MAHGNNCDTEIVQISVNFKGNGYFLTVDMDTAITLLNDQNQAEEYIKTAFPHLRNENEEEKENLKKVWISKRKPSDVDEEATKLMLELGQKYDHLFNDKKTVKNVVWAKVASEMKTAGYDLGTTSKDAAAKCKQKFINMESRYIKYMQHIKTTGEGKRDPPPFYAELHSLLGGKDKIYPENLQGSEELSSTDDTIISEPSSSEMHTTIKNRFSKVKKTVKPTSSSEAILQEIREDRANRKEEFSQLKQLLEKENEQREKMLDVFRDYLNTKKRKRQERSESDSD